MEFIKKMFESISKYNLIHSIVIIVVSIIIYNALIFLITKISEKGTKKLLNTKRGKTYIKLVKSIIRYIFIIITLLVLLQANGINVSSMLAGVGIISVIIGFAVQDALKDIIKGFDIISDDYYQVGDVIKYGDIEGKVISVGIKTTKIEDIRSFNLISISNRNIEQVEVVSHLINIDIPMPYELKVVESEEVLMDIVSLVKSLKDVENCEYRGVNDLSDSSVKYQIKVYCKPINKMQVRRDSLRCVLLGLEKNNISVPYNQLDVHQK